MSDLGKRIGVFVGVLVLATAVSALALGIGGQSAPDIDQSNNTSFTSGDSVASVPEEDGELSMSEDGDDTVVVIDTTRSQQATQESIAPMATELTESGATVRYNTGGESSFSSAGGLNATLSDADAYVVMGPRQGYSDGEIAGLEAFSDAGGRVVLMDEPTGQPNALAALLGQSRQQVGQPSPLVPLLSQYGLSYDNGYLYNMANNSNNYRNVYGTPAGDSSLTDGVDRAVFHESIAVNGGETVVTATENTTLSSTRRADSYSVITREGNLVAVGDTSIMTEEYVYRADNEVLVSNLLDFLVSGEKDPEDAPTRSGSSGGGFGGGDGGSSGDGGFGGGGF